MYPATLTVDRLVAILDGLRGHPIVAMFYELDLRHAYIDAKVTHSQLSPREREVLFGLSTKISTRPRLIIMYDVSSQGLNLHEKCHTAFMAVPARNYSLEAQGLAELFGYVIAH